MKLYRDKARKFVPKAFGIKHYENPAGTKIINDLTALYFLWNSYGYYKKICLATHSLSLFFERNELLEVPYRRIV